MRYLVEIDGVFYGYETPVILRCDISAAFRQGCQIGRILEKQAGIQTIYKDISTVTLSQIKEAV